MFLAKNVFKTSGFALSFLKAASIRPFTTANVVPQTNEFLVRNCLQTGLGFNPAAVTILAASNPALFEGTPSDAKIPCIWTVMQRYGFADLEKFRLLCLREPRIAVLDPKHVDLLLQTLDEYGILADPAAVMEIFTMHPKILLKKAEKTRRLLYAMYRIIMCEKSDVGQLVLRVPTVLLTSVRIFSPCS